jgi:predicted ATP-dependent endonuclease of OLD family
VKKLAIFVEGKTEQIFVEKLLQEIADKIALR